MNAEEATTLCRAAKSVCPQQKFDEFTPDFWHPLLSDIEFEDAKRALIEVAKRQPFVSPAEIRAEVFRDRRQMIAGIDAVNPPWQLADRQAEEQRWIANYRHAIADGLPENTARAKANHLSGITDDPEPLAIGAGPAAIKAQMEEAALELARKHSLAEADKRAAADEKRERYKRIRAEELARTDAPTPHDPAVVDAGDDNERLDGHG